MQASRINNSLINVNSSALPLKAKAGQSFAMSMYADKKSINEISSSAVRANYLPVSFKGNAPSIKNAFIITGEKEDIPLLVTQKNDSYVVDFDSQTEIIYGLDAAKYLYGNEYFPYDTQVIFPKKAEGVLEIGDKKVPLPENSAVMINAGTKASVKTKTGFPMVIVSKKDYDWYERYGKNAEDNNIKNKFLELMYHNSHLYNGEFTPNSFLSEDIKSEDFLSSVGIEKYKSANNLINDLYAIKDSLPADKKAEIEHVKALMDKLLAANVLQNKADGFVRFTRYCTTPYFLETIKDLNLSQAELDIILPFYEQARQVYKDSKFAIKNSAESYNPQTIEKMKQAGILYANKDDAAQNIYWKECFGNEQTLRARLSEAGFSYEEQEEVVRNWHQANKTGFDVSGLKFIDEQVAVYNLNDKLNNWTNEKTNWVTNSTAASSTKGQTPFIGVSMVQLDDNKIIPMGEIRKEEKLHSHPNLAEKKQTEIYLVTSGAAALNVVKEGKSCVKILKEGDLAVVGPGVAHCINSILGEYEHIVAQVPSAFQYGFGFKAMVQPPVDYDENALKDEAKILLSSIA